MLLCIYSFFELWLCLYYKQRIKYKKQICIYEFERNYDISDTFFKNQLNIIKSRKERKTNNGYKYPLLYDFVLNRLAIVLKDVRIARAKAMLDADNVNFHPARLSGWIRCLITAETTNGFLYRFQLLGGLHLWYKISRGYWKLENYSFVTVMKNWWTGCIAKSDITRRLEIFCMAESYCPEIARLKSAFSASCLDKKDLRNFFGCKRDTQWQWKAEKKS